MSCTLAIGATDAMPVLPLLAIFVGMCYLISVELLISPAYFMYLW